jgi:hypothetical protein
VLAHHAELDAFDHERRSLTGRAFGRHFERETQSFIDNAGQRPDAKLQLRDSHAARAGGRLAGLFDHTLRYRKFMHGRASPKLEDQHGT